MHKGGPPGGHKPPPLAAVHVVHPPAGSAWGAAGAGNHRENWFVIKRISGQNV